MTISKVHFDTPLDGVVGDPTLVVQPHGPRPAIPGPPPSRGTVEPGYEGPTDEPLDWQDFANCTGVDPDLFFPGRGESTREAKAVCRGCSVRADCLEYALANGEKFGIWGGMSERERRKVRRNRMIRAQADPSIVVPPPIRELQPCGTEAAYQRHRRAGEPPCDPCREAQNRANAARREATSA